MTKALPGREPVQIVEILQPLCENDYGTSPCTASGTDDEKCYNTRATCQDTANFALGTPLSLFFSSGKVAEMDVSGASYIIPSLVSVSTAPTRVNLAGSNPDAQGLGNRALATITFQDRPHTDRVVDPYLSGRSWNPYDKDRGSFWSRWLVRNKYRQNVVVRVYEGYAGEALSAMTKRTFFLQSVSGPTASGRVTMQCKDVLARIEERKAQAPVASPGELYADITDSATSIEVANAVEADYPASGTIRVNDELMTYSARATSTNGITFTITARGSDGTTAVAHSAEDAVQECLRYTAQRIDTIVEDLMTNYGGVAATYLDTANWATEVDAYLPSYLLTTIITEPTSVTELVSQIQVQGTCFFWWDERDALVKMKAIRGVDAEVDLLTEETNIIAGSVSLTEKPRERVSQAWIYWGTRDYTRAVDDPNRYSSLIVNADLESETDALYGEPSIRKIFGRWLPSGALAENTATKIITRYVDVPQEIRFRLDAKDRDYWVGETIRIEHHLDVDEFGAKQIRRWTIISAKEVTPGEVVEYLAEDTTLYGEISFILAGGAADYPGAASAAFGAAYIGNSDGLLSDGEPSARIS